MKKLLSFAICLFIISSFLSSCKKEDNPVSNTGTPINTTVTKQFKRTGVNKVIAGNNAYTFDTLNAVITNSVLSNFTSDISLTLDSIEGVDVTKIKVMLIHQSTSVLTIDTLRNPGTGFINTTLSDSSITPIGSGSGTYTGIFKPQNPMSAFKNLSADGQYILRIFNSGSVKTGVIKSWSITVTYNVSPSNYCLDFNGTSNYVAVPSSGSIDSLGIKRTFTLEGWYNISGFPRYNYFSFLDKLNHWYCEYYKADSTWTLVFPGRPTLGAKVPLMLNTWQHIAITFDGLNDRTIFYLNGQFIKQIDTAYVLNTFYHDTLFVAYGNSGADEYGFGKIDEIRIWNIVRSEFEIANYYNRYLTGNEPGLIMYFKMNEGTGNVTLDASPRQNTGYLRNSPYWSTEGPVINP